MKNDVKKQFAKTHSTERKQRCSAGQFYFETKWNQDSYLDKHPGAHRAHPCAHCFANIHSEQQLKIHLENGKKK